MPAFSSSPYACAAPHIAALFPSGVAAFEAQGPYTIDLLFDAERPYIAHAVESRVHEFIAGRVCARAALAQLGHPPVAIPAAADRAPIWPSGFTGSISHAGGYCVAVAARVTDAGRKRGITALGVDVEQVGQVLPTLWSQLMCQKEIARLQALDGRDRDVTASLIFSAKEAFYKAQYTLTGGWVDFGDASIVLLENSFVLNLTNADLAIAQLARSFEGRFLVGSGHVITALAI